MSSRPSDASIDAMFASARSARVVAGPGHRGGVLLEVPRSELPLLRATLRIVEPDEQFHCMCLGDLAVELQGRFLSAGRISYHHGISVRVDGWSSDASLVDGPALLRFLAEHDVPEPLLDYERRREDDRRLARAREAWVAATPPFLRPELAALENGPLGMPRRLDPSEVDALLARLRGDASDTTLARALLGWLAVGQGPWSGYPSYETVPMRLLDSIPIQAVIEVAMDPSVDDATVAAAARFFGDHELVTFHKSKLALVPDAFFERARPLLKVEDDRHRHEHAARVAKGARAKRAAPYSVGELEVLGESSNGPLSGLGVIGDELISADVGTVVRFRPDSVSAIPIVDTRDTFVWISPQAPAAWATGRRGEIATESGIVATGENGPVEISASEHGVAWIAKQGNDARAVRAVRFGDPTVRTLSTGSLLWAIAVHGERAWFLEAGWRGGGTLCSAPLGGGDVARAATVPELGPSMGTPRWLVDGSGILLPVGKSVLAIDAEGASRVLIDAPNRIHAIAADADHVALVVGDDDGDDRKRWSIAAAPRTGGTARILASFERAPYHRHPLVVARGRACTVVDQRVLAARLR